MDIPALAAETVRYLAPALPALIFVGTEAAKATVKKTTDAVLDAGRKLWEKLRPHAEARPALLQAAHDVASKPEDSAARDKFVMQLRSLFETELLLAREINGAVEQIRVEGKGNIVAGRDIAARDIDLHIG